MVHTWVMGSGTGIQTRQMKQSKQMKRFFFLKHSRADVRPHERAANRSSGAGVRLARYVFLLVSFAILFTGFTLMRTFADESATGVPAAEEQAYTVDAGDSLWAIAEEVKRPGMDTREAIHQIMKRNDLTSSSLRSGDRLIIPARVLD